MNDVMKTCLGVLSGAVIAVVLPIIAAGLLAMTLRFFQTFAQRAIWFSWLTLIVLPIIAFVGITAAIWREQKPVAALVTSS